MFPLMNFTYATANLWLITSALWGISLLTKRVDHVDSWWPMIFSFLSLYMEWYNPHHSMRSVLVTLLISVWGVRLGGYLFYRNFIVGKSEDKRYKDLRKRHGGAFTWYSYFNPYMIQLAVALVVSVALISIYDSSRQKNAHPLLATFSDWIAIALYAVGMLFEVGGDMQLMKFKSNPKNKGKLFTEGLWRYTRHPNYFGSACIFWSMFFFSHAQGAIWTVIAPIVMTANLLKGTGVELTEWYMVREHPEYKKYVESTSNFVPMPPKQRAGESQRVAAH
mmetsp:Transcript_7516/g.28218  ORF Transcript_7516/g.28218 Transcript_7516/m.28218 type:complete len:278 (+) Transcript_7516:1686-2519(+)